MGRNKVTKSPVYNIEVEKCHGFDLTGPLPAEFASQVKYLVAGYDPGDRIRVLVYGATPDVAKRRAVAIAKLLQAMETQETGFILY